MKNIYLILVLIIFNKCSTVNKIVESTEYSNWGNTKKLRKKILSKMIKDKLLIGLDKDIVIFENFQLPQGDPKSAYIIGCISIEGKPKKYYYFSNRLKKVKYYDTTNSSKEEENLIDSLSTWVKEEKIKNVKKYEKYTLSGHGYYFLTILNVKKKLKKTHKFKKFIFPRWR